MKNNASDRRIFLLRSLFGAVIALCAAASDARTTPMPSPCPCSSSR